jgi:hypothetical protein
MSEPDRAGLAEDQDPPLGPPEGDAAEDVDTGEDADEQPEKQL